MDDAYILIKRKKLSLAKELGCRCSNRRWAERPSRWSLVAEGTSKRRSTPHNRRQKTVWPGGFWKGRCLKAPGFGDRRKAIGAGTIAV